MSCVCCHKPRYKRLVDALYPQDYQSVDPVTQDLEKLLYLARSEPHRLDDVGEYLAWKLKRALVRDRRGHVCVSLKIMEKLLTEVSSEHLRLLAESFLNMVHELLQSNDHFFQNLAANSFVSFAELSEDNPPYHRQYEFCIERFAAMSLTKTNNNETMYIESRQSGLSALRGAVRKVGEGNNLWNSHHLNIIISAYLINIQDHSAANNSLEETSNTFSVLVQTAETGLKELVTVASISHSYDILCPVLEHFDLNSVWLKEDQFATNTFVFIIQTMQPQVRYLAIQALLAHLDNKHGNEKQIKSGILEVLSSCVHVAADGSIGPSVLDVFRTLVKHLRNSIERSQLPEQDKSFHETIVRIVGEFASVLPDYHNPDIMNLIYSYLPLEGDGTIKSMKSCNEKQAELISLLVNCLCVVAESAKPSLPETALPETLLVSLSQLMDIERDDIQLSVISLWHKMLDHHRNHGKIPVHTNWDSLGKHVLTLGNSSIRFRHQARKVLFPKLVYLAECLFMTKEHALGFYNLLSLLTLEFASSGINDILILMVELEDLALTQTELPQIHCNFLHACVAGCLHIVMLCSDNDNLVAHLEDVLKRRQEIRKQLLPQAALKEIHDMETNTVSVSFQLNEDEVEEVDDKVYFKLIEHGFINRVTDLMRNSSTLRDIDNSRTFRSYSMDHSGEDQESHEVITFNHLKEETLEKCSEDIDVNEDQQTPSFDQMVGLVSLQNSALKDEIANILKSASPRSTMVHDGPPAYDLRMPSFI